MTTFPPSPAQGEPAGVSELPIKLREAADRILNHCFNKSGDSALVSIPADRSRDVDLLLFEAADQLEVARQQLAELHQSIADERIVFWEKDADQRKAIENREARLRAAEQQLAELREANAAALRVSLIHTATHEIAKVREERDEAREAVEDIEKERDKLLQQVAEMRGKVLRLTTYDMGPIGDGWIRKVDLDAALAPTSQPSQPDAVEWRTVGDRTTMTPKWQLPNGRMTCVPQPSRGKCEHCAGDGYTREFVGAITDTCAYCHGTGKADCAQPERQGAENICNRELVNLIDDTKFNIFDVDKLARIRQLLNELYQRRIAERDSPSPPVGAS